MNLVRISLLLAAGVAPFALLGTSCLLKGFEISPAGNTPDASDDSDVAPGCGHATYPQPPDAGTAGGMVDFAVAVHSIDFGEDNVDAGASAPPPGLDLDNLCTGGPFDEGAGCKYPWWATADHRDYAKGIDNAGAQVFKYVQSVAGPGSFGSAYYSDRAHAGYWSILLRVSDYNGEPNDAQVRLAIYTTRGLDSDPDAGPTGQPKWDGSDVWSVSADSTIGGDLGAPLYADTNAYVTDNVVVATLPKSEIKFSGGSGSISIRLTAGTIMATIGQENGQWKLTSGVIAARWTLADVFNTLSSANLNGQIFCNNPTQFIYGQFKQEICKYADILSGIGGATEPCDSLSFGLGFTADPAQLGAVFTPMVDPSTCPPGEDPALDSCDTLMMPDAGADSGAGGGMP